MALKIELTDEKGVKVRYLKIHEYKGNSEKITVTLRSYVNQATRDAESQAVEQNRLASEYDANLDKLRSELDSLSSQLQPNGEGDEEVRARIAELTKEVNSLTLDADRPSYVEEQDRYYSEQEVELDYFEPISLSALYKAISELPEYAGAEQV